MKDFLSRTWVRRSALFSYWTWLTVELLLSEPWILYGRNLAEHPPVDTHSTAMSLLLHTSSFLILGFLLTWNFGRMTRWLSPGMYRAAFAYAIVTELLQFYVPRRWPSVEDAVFNLIGLSLGYLACRLIIRRLSTTDSPVPFRKAA